MQLALFIIFAALAIAGALNLLLQKHPINSALSLVVVMMSLAVLYWSLGAEFLAAAQVIVYSGAIMVLFVFVIMLLNAGGEQKRPRRLWPRYAGVPLLFVFLALMGYVGNRLLPPSGDVKFGSFTGGSAQEIGRKLFTVYLLPFEVTSVLILIAIVGAIVLARKEVD
jgi:NADH-quinone oxidoreductase subunit J